jgi:hypothetical protein
MTSKISVLLLLLFGLIGNFVVNGYFSQYILRRQMTNPRLHHCRTLACLHSFYARRSTQNISFSVVSLFGCFEPDNDWPYLHIGYVIDLFQLVARVGFVAFTTTPERCEQVWQCAALLIQYPTHECCNAGCL